MSSVHGEGGVHPTNKKQIHHGVAFADTMAWRWRISPPQPHEPLLKGLQRVACQGFVQFKDVAEKKNLFATDLFHCILHP